MPKHRFGTSTASIPTPGNWNYYVTWVLYSILGKLAEADDVITRYQSQVYSVAHYLQTLIPPPKNTLYRGILLEPNQISNGLVKPDPAYKSVSFTEDKQAACWFADIHSTVSGAVLEQRPNVTGYIISYTPSPRNILFHHSWQNLPTPMGTKYLSEFANYHPHIAPQAFQVEWSLRTQQEVIVKPIKTTLPVIAIEQAGCLNTETLESVYGPKW